MKTSLYIIVLLAFFMASCTKDESVADKTAKGRVVDLVTGGPVAGAYVALFESSGTILQPGLKLSAETFTDTNGYFNFGTAKGTEVQAKKDNYYDSRIYTTIGTDYINNPVVTIEPLAYINLHCKNVNKIYSSNLFYLQIKGAAVRFTGFEVDTIVKGIKIGAGIKQIDYVLVRFWDNIKYDSLINVTINPVRFDTTDVFVNY